jgi:hypothetical protein
MLLIFTATMVDAAALRWPWEQQHHYRHKRHEAPLPRSDKEDPVTPFAEPETNCPEILEAEKTLGGPEGGHWKHQLSMLTDGQRANIAKCLRDVAP